MHRICASLSESGFDVLLLGRLLPQSKLFSPNGYKAKRLKCIFNKGFLFYAEFNLRLLFFLAFVRIDIFGAIDLDTILPNTILAKLRGKKLVYDAHEYFTEVPELVSRERVKRIWKKIESLCVPEVDLAYTVGNSISQLYEKEYDKVFFVIKNVPIPKASQPLTKNNRFVLYQGALNVGRCLEPLIEAMTLIDCDLVIAGEGDLSLNLRTLVKRMGLNEKVKFTGRLEPKELAELTNKAYIGFNVLENKGLSYYYSLANKCFDYVQAGIPSICSPFPEYLTLNKDYEVFRFTEPSASSIAESINELLQNQGKYQLLASNCLNARKVWNWNIEQEKLKSLYARFK